MKLNDFLTSTLMLGVSALTVLTMNASVIDKIQKEEVEGNTLGMSVASAYSDTDVKSSGTVLAKRVGGDGTVELPKGYKLMLVTYKEDDMWLLYRPMREGEHAEHYILQEDSRWGLFEGTVRIQEVE